MFDFKLKQVYITRPELSKKKIELEGLWIKSVLIGLSVSKIYIEAVQTGKMNSLQEWRNYLFDNYNIEIIKSVLDETVSIYRTEANEKRTLIAEWKKPEVQIEKETDKYKLVLKYWQIL